MLRRKDIFFDLLGLQCINCNKRVVINQPFFPGTLERSGKILFNQFVYRAGRSAFFQEGIPKLDYITLFEQSDTALSARTKEAAKKVSRLLVGQKRRIAHRSSLVFDPRFELFLCARITELALADALQ